MQRNLNVRKAAKTAGVPLWKVAAALGISEATIVRWLRVDLSPEKEEQIMSAISSLAKEVG